MRIKDKKFKIICVVLITLIINFASISSTLGYKENQYIEVLVIFEPNKNVEVSGVEYIYQWDILNAFNGRMPYSTYELLKKSPSVKFITTEIEVEGFRQLDETCPSGVWQIEADRVWGGERSHPAVGNTDVIPGNPSGQGIKVAIIDGGIDYNHNDLESNYGGGINYIDMGYAPMDYDGHGTACAGIIAAVDNEIDVIGVAPHSTIYSVKGLTSGAGFYLPALVNSIYWCMVNDIDVISMSWGAWPNWNPAFIGLEIVLDWAYEEGIVLVAATGNYPGYLEDHVLFPASLPSVIAVGASDSNGERVDIPGEWSSCYGPEVDVVAPGLYIRTTKLGGGATIYPHFSGTSAACPHVAGICALLLSQDPTLTPSEIKTILQQTAEDVGDPGQDDETGFGLVNAYGALDAENPTVSITNPFSYYVSGTVSISASASDNYRLHKVQFKIDSGSWHIDYDATNGWSWNWNTFSYSEGLHTIYCRAYDARGNWAQTQKTVSVRNQGGGGGGGGGGCPILSVYNGSEFIEEGLLDIHNPDGIDVVTIHELVTEPKFVKKRCFLRLTEHPITISHIDKVELYGRLSNGLLVPLALKSAFHSSLGNVLPELKFSDDDRVDVLGAIHNNGTSEFIDIEFKSLSNQIFSGFSFIIEGHNYIVK